MTKTFNNLTEFNAAVDPQSHDFDQVIWVVNAPHHKEVICRWLDEGEYDGGVKYIYHKQ